MREGLDINSFLQKGYWENTRAKSPDSRFSSHSYHNNSVPRYSHSTEYPPELRRRSFYPPAPSVEDEADSLAKEHGSVVSSHPEEEPRHPGEPDQLPIIEVLHEFNPERRFVVVPNSSSPSEEARDELKKAAKARRAESSPGKDKDHYDANTCRKYVIIPPGEEEDKGKSRPVQDEHERRPNRERRKSRLEDLPAIVTDFHTGDRNEARREDLRRSKSATSAAEPTTDDYFSPRRSSGRLREEPLLTPDVIKHSTKGRDRAYYDYSGATSPNQGRTRTSQVEDPRDRRYSRRPDEGSARPYPASPVESRKSSETPRNVRRTSRDGYMGYEKDHSGYDKPRQYSERPSKASRTNSSSSAPRPDRDSLRPRSSSFRGKRESPPYNDSRYSSDEDVDRRPSGRRRGKSFVHEERNGHLATPSESKPPGRRSKPNTPLASPRISQGDLFPEPYESNMSRSPRSATFPINRDHQKSEAQYPGEEELPSRPLSRVSTAKSVLNAAAPIALPIITAVAAAAAGAQESGSPTDRRSVDMPVPQKPRVPADSKVDSRSILTTPSSSPPKRPWQPPKFDPTKDGVSSDQRTTSYRRYSEGFKGELPDLPDCPRTKEEAGHIDWLTLPNCNNLNICPSCYQSAFGNTQWRNDFRPAPFRPRERPLKCDFGASMWYHIAWLLTQTHKKPDLRLFQGLNNVAAAHQPCSGKQPAVRIWYTIKDPATQRPIRGFKMCHHCARSIETLLPSLLGVFVPMDSPAETRSGICCMHQQSYAGSERKRFLEYWDIMETTSDLAVAAHIPPNIRSLADRIREVSTVDECYGSQPVSGRKWHTMRSMPFVTVCEECFNEVIWPEIERDPSGIQAEFYKNVQKLEVGACMLYSPRMRSYFRKAVASDDLEYFRSRIMRRKQKEQEFHDKVRGLDPNVLGREWVEAEIERARREWRRHE